MDMMNTSLFFRKKDEWDRNAAFLDLWDRQFSKFPESIPGVPDCKAFGTHVTKLETELLVDTENLAWEYSSSRLRFCSEQVAYLLHSLKDVEMSSEKKGKASEKIGGRVSELCHITLDSEQREKLKIPSNADMFCWANPIQQEGSLTNDRLNFLEKHDFDVQFLLFGGFMYFKKNDLIRCNCIVPSDKSGLIFGPSHAFSKTRHKDFHQKLEQGRLSLITIKSLHEEGAKQFSWILPGELKGCPHGGFLYLFDKPEKDRYFGLVGTTVNAEAFRRNWEEAIEEKFAHECYQELLKLKILPAESKSEESVSDLETKSEEESKSEESVSELETKSEESPNFFLKRWLKRNVRKFPRSLPGTSEGCFTFEAKLAQLEDMKVDFKDERWSYAENLFSFSGTISRLHPVTIGAQQRVPVNIPSEANYFCWANPANRQGAEIDVEPEHPFLKFGGFMYFNKNTDLIACTYIRPSNNPGFLFGPPNLFDRYSMAHNTFLRELDNKKQLNDITMQHLKEAGACKFCWLLPGELKGCSYGGFLYIFDAEKKIPNMYFPLMAVGGIDTFKEHWEKEADGIHAVEEFRNRFKLLQKKAEELADTSPDPKILNQIFLIAAKTGQLLLVEKLKEKTQDDIKEEALKNAASNGHREVCDSLLLSCNCKSRSTARLERPCLCKRNVLEKERAFQCAAENGFWDICLLLYEQAANEGKKEEILQALRPEGKKKLFSHSAYCNDSKHYWKDIYDTLLADGKNMLGELALKEDNTKPSDDGREKEQTRENEGGERVKRRESVNSTPWFLESSVSLLQNKKHPDLKLQIKEMTIILQWEVKSRGRDKKHLTACFNLINKEAEYLKVLRNITPKRKIQSHKKSDREEILEKVEYLMEAISKTFVTVELDSDFVLDLFNLFQDYDVHQILEKTPYTALILFLSDSFFKKDYVTSLSLIEAAKLRKISKLIHTKVVKLCSDSPQPIFFMIKVAAAFSKRGEKRTTHQGEYLLLRDYFVEIAREAMKIDAFANTDHTFQALGGEAASLLSFLEEEKPISYAMRYNLDEIICSPHVQELLELVWGTPRLMDALSPFQFQWSESILKHVTDHDSWSFDMHRKIPVLRALVTAILKFVFLGLCYVALFSEDRGLQHRLSHVFMVASIGYWVEHRYQYKPEGHRRKMVVLILISVWTRMIWAGSPIKYCNMVMAVTCAVTASFSLEFLNYFETFGFMMVALSEIWRDIEIYAIFYLFLLGSFGVLFTVTNPDLEEFNDLPSTLITLVSGSFGNFDLAIFCPESPNKCTHEFHTFGQIMFVLYLFFCLCDSFELAYSTAHSYFHKKSRQENRKIFPVKGKLCS